MRIDLAARVRWFLACWRWIYRYPDPFHFHRLARTPEQHARASENYLIAARRYCKRNPYPPKP